MAPKSSEQFKDLQFQIFEINQLIPEINSMDSLLKAKQLYLSWLATVMELFSKDTPTFGDRIITRPEALPLWKGEVHKHLSEGGSGVIFGDARTLSLIEALKKDVNNSLILIGNLSPFFNNKILKKENDAFFFKEEAVVLNSDTDPFILLNILFNFTDKEGFISYSDIEKHFKKLLPAERSFNHKTIKNALDNIFVRAKVNNKILKNRVPSGKELIETKRGQGLILNNENWK